MNSTPLTKRLLTISGLALAIAFIAIAPLFAGPTAYDKNPVMPAPPVCDWHGFYIGMNVGVAGLNTSVTDLDDFSSAATHSVEDTNFAGGGQMGYNFQKGAFVFGLEVDGDYLNTDHTQDYDAYYHYRAKVDFQGSLRARAGIAVDNALIYATAGLAVSHGHSGFSGYEDDETSEIHENAFQDDWQAGFVGGVGVEYKFNCHWSARMEALYFHYPNSSTTLSDDSSYRFETQNEDYTVRFGVNYLFGGGR